MTAIPKGQIVCAVRGGPESRETVKRAIALALESGARLTFFHVMDAEFLGHATHGSLRVVYRELREMGEFVMLILCDRARALGVVQVDHVQREGNIRVQLAKLSRETGAELLVIGRPAAGSTNPLFEAKGFDAFVAELEQGGALRVIAVEPVAVARKDRQDGLVL